MSVFPEESLKQFRETLGLKESPLGIYYTNDKPEGVTPKEGIQGCMIGLIQNARKKPRRAPATYCVFKPIEQFQSGIEPEVVAFFAPPDVLSGLFTLTNYALERTDAVFTPFGSGCGTILTYPLKEAGKEQPRAILGMFDVSARPMIEKDALTLSMPYLVFLKLLENA